MRSLLDQINHITKDSYEEIVEICSRLIQFPSVNPPGITRDIVDYIEAYFSDLGMETELIEKVSGKSNICVRLQGDKAGNILWLGHLDVVPTGDQKLWHIDPFSGQLINDRIYGRGATDMKGSCAAAMMAAKILHTLDPSNLCSIEFWFTCDEETGTNGVEWLSKTGRLNGDVCIIGDSLGNLPHHPTIDIGCKGYLRPQIKTQGCTAHGSQPFLGRNAIDRLLHVMKDVKKIEKLRLKIPKSLKPIVQTSIQSFKCSQELTDLQVDSLEKIFYYPTASLNMIRGGVQVNVVPDSAEATFDIRITPGNDLNHVKTRISQLVEQSGVENVAVEYLNEAEGYFEDPTSTVVNNLMEAVRLVTRINPRLKLLLMGTDAIPLKESVSISCLGFGVGVQGKAHALNEFVTASNLLVGMKVYTLFPLLFTKPAS